MVAVYRGVVMVGGAAQGVVVFGNGGDEMMVGW